VPERERREPRHERAGDVERRQPPVAVLGEPVDSSIQVENVV